MENINKLLSPCSYNTYSVFSGFFQVQTKKLTFFKLFFLFKHLFIFNLFTKTFNILINFIQKNYLIKFIGLGSSYTCCNFK